MQYDFNLVANGGQQIDVKGKFFKYVAGTGKIRVRINGGGYVDLLPGQGVWNVEFSTLNVSDRSGAANYGTLLAGIFDFHDDRVAGTVEVVDGGKARTIANQAFMGGTSIIANAAEYPYVQLFNNTTTKRVILKSVVLSTLATQQVALSGYSTAITTLVGGVQSKQVGGAASSAEMRVKSDAAIFGNPAFVNPNVTANVPFIYTFQEPLVLLPGNGVVARAGTANSYLSVNFEFTEELI